MYYVYILFSKDKKKRYIGSSSNLKKRLQYHNDGLVKSTQAYRPWKIIYYEAHTDKMLARKAELFYKTGQGRRQIKKKLGLDEEINNIAESEDT